MSDQNESPSILDEQGLLQETHEEQLSEMETDAIDSSRREEPFISITTQTCTCSSSIDAICNYS